MDKDIVISASRSDPLLFLGASLVADGRGLKMGAICFEKARTHPAKLDYIARKKGGGWDAAMGMVKFQSAELEKTKDARGRSMITAGSKSDGQVVSGCEENVSMTEQQ